MSSCTATPIKTCQWFIFCSYPICLFLNVDEIIWKFREEILLRLLGDNAEENSVEMICLFENLLQPIPMQSKSSFIHRHLFRTRLSPIPSFPPLVYEIKFLSISLHSIRIYGLELSKQFVSEHPMARIPSKTSK